MMFSKFTKIWFQLLDKLWFCHSHKVHVDLQPQAPYHLIKWAKLHLWTEYLQGPDTADLLQSILYLNCWVKLWVWPNYFFCYGTNCNSTYYISWTTNTTKNKSQNKVGLLMILPKIFAPPGQELLVADKDLVLLIQEQRSTPL